MPLKSGLRIMSFGSKSCTGDTPARPFASMFVPRIFAMGNRGGDYLFSRRPSMELCACTMSGIISRMGKWRVCFLLLVSAISANPSFADAVAPQLTFDSVNVKQEGVVGFSVLSLGTENRSDFSGPRFLVGQTEDEVFRLYVDVDSIQQVRFNAFTFTAYLEKAEAGGQTAYKYQITGNPTGSFRDTPVRVTFHVKLPTTN